MVALSVTITKAVIVAIKKHFLPFHMLQMKADVLLFLFFFVSLLQSLFFFGYGTLDSKFICSGTRIRLLKLVSELKRTAIFSGLASLNENVCDTPRVIVTATISER
jgi:membrane-associated PAP2 superfamily phosphatase